MAYVLSSLFPPQFESVTGLPLVLGSIEFYIFNTTTPTPFYTDEIGTSGGVTCALGLLGQPINGGGTSIQIFLDDAIDYKVIRKDAAGTPIAPTLGPYMAANSSIVVGLGDSTDVAKGDALVAVKQPYTGGAARTQHAKNAETLSITDFVTTQAAMDALAGLRYVPAGSYAGATATNLVGFDIDQNASFSTPIVPFPLTFSGATKWIKSFRNTSLSPYDIYSNIDSTIVSYDVVSSVLEVKAGSTIGHATAIAGYFKNSNNAALPNCVALFGEGMLLADGAAGWGVNTLLTDTPTRLAGTTTNRLLIGAELDFNINGNGTSLIGVSVGGNGLATGNIGTAFIVNSLSGLNSLHPLRFSTGFASFDGCAVNALSIGTLEQTGANIASQKILMGYFDGASARQNLVIQLTSGFLSFDATSAWNGLNIGSGGIYVGSATLINTTVALSNAAAAATATLTNAPVAGNPTKWININDNGTTRRIPAW